MAISSSKRFTVVFGTVRPSARASSRQKCSFSAWPSHSPVGGFKIGVLVCYDVDFPEVSRILALGGADLLMCPSRIVRQGVEPWHQYVTIRSLENRIAVVAPNVYSPPLFTGQSVIVSLKEDPKMKISHPRMRVFKAQREGIIVEDIDLDLHARLRKERFADRRPETYVWN